MLFAARLPVSVGIVAWPGGEVVTIVVKRAFDLVNRGVAAASDGPTRLGLDRFDDAGLLLYPSDFAPVKALCDVGVVGEALRDPTGPIRLVVDPLRKLAERGSLLGPRPAPGPLGDPTDRARAGDWTSAAFDFESFQWAPQDQRMVQPALPLEVVVDAGPDRFATRIDAPGPDALLLDESGWHAPRVIVLRLDGIGFDLARRRVELVWRGVVELIPDAEPLLVVETASPLRAWSPHAMRRWPRAEAVEAPVLRRLASREAPREGALPPAVRQDTMVRQDTPPHADPLVDTASALVSPAHRSVLPFAAASSAPPVHHPPLVAAPRSRAMTTRIVDDAEEPDPLTGTVAMARLEAAPLPFRPTVETPVLRVAAPAAVIAAPAAVIAAPAAVPPSPPRAEASAPARTEGLSIAQFTAIKAQLWTAGESRAATLRAHGLTELQWRLAERRFVRQIDRGQGDDVRRMVRHLRDALAERARRDG